jgi:hypothetical protein
MGTQMVGAAGASRRAKMSAIVRRTPSAIDVCQFARAEKSAQSDESYVIGFPAKGFADGRRITSKLGEAALANCHFGSWAANIGRC